MSTVLIAKTKVTDGNHFEEDSTKRNKKIYLKKYVTDISRKYYWKARTEEWYCGFYYIKKANDQSTVLQMGKSHV